MLTANETPGKIEDSGLPWYRGLSGYHWFVVIVCWMAWLFDTMDQQLFVLARLPAIAGLLKDLHTDPKQLSLVVSRYSGYATSIMMLGYATGGIIFGILGDRWGRAKTMLLAVLFYSMATGLSAMSVSWVDFAIYRFLTGAGAGGTFAAGVSMVAEVLPARSRSYALGFLQAMGAVGNMMAACVSFIIRPRDEFFNGISGWRLMFLVGIVPAILALCVMRKLKEPESWVRAKQAKAKETDAGKIVKMGSTREMFADTRWRRNAIVGILMGLAGITGLWGSAFWLPDLVCSVTPKENRDWYISMAMLLFNGGAAVGTYAFAALMSRISRRMAFALAFGVAIVVIMAVFGFMTRPGHIWWMAPLLGVGTLSLLGGYSIYFPELFPTRLRSTGTGLCYNTGRYLSALGPMMTGILTSAFAAHASELQGGFAMSKFSILSSLGGMDHSLRYAAIVVASVYIVGLLALPFAPETKDRPLPE